MRLARVIHCVDAHAEGEPSRIVVGGVLDVPGDSMLEKMRHLEADDRLRRILLFEPRGSAPLSADVVFPSAVADAGFIIMESSSYEGMSGTNTLNTAVVLLETGMVELTEPVTELTLEAPAGIVKVRAECAGGRVERLEFENVPSFAAALDAPVEVPGRGTLRVDVGYGGAFAAFVDAAALGFSLLPDEARELAELGERIRPHVAEQVEIAHPSAPDHLSFVVFVAPGRDGGDARHATVVSPGRLDRSPTGTATSARMAVLDARGALGERYVAESVLGTRFTGRLVARTRVGERDAIVPAVSGRAWVTGFHQLVVDPADPLGDGFKLPDTWGPGRAEGLLNRAPRPPSR